MTANESNLRKKILVVEDDAFMRENLAMSLHDSGYDVIEAKAGKEALEKIKDDGFVAIISDLYIPPPNGLELYKTIHSKLPDIPFFIITAFPEQRIAEEAKKLLGNFFLPKPVAVKKILDYIRKMDGTE